MIAAIMGPLGGAFGYVFHLFFVSPEDENHPEIAKENIFKLCWVTAIVFSIIYLIAMILFKEKPDIPPTKSASVVNTEPISQSMKKLATNGNFWCVMNAFALVYGCLTTFSQEVSLIIEPFGFDSVFFSSHILQADNALLGVAFALSGLVGAFFTATFVSKTRKYRLATFLVCLGATIAVCGLTAVLPLNNRLIAVVASAALGLFVMSILAVGLDFGCEVTYPVPANNTNGVMLAYSQILCAIQILAASFILTSPKKGEKVETFERKMEALIVCMILVVSILGGLGFATFTKEDLRKTNIDKGYAVNLKDDKNEVQSV
eukprot:TRINITY_DN88037_c0_g1_i1.p2 TRINITY_DN88037_c0_g1~~TRINITY_DN88037_c0_g1_i1.p2  ORF type:complete len:318 (-),score=18.56 TRINITY_DN88037_c0_g1_i1:138-1091(-)